MFQIAQRALVTIVGFIMLCSAACSDDSGDAVGEQSGTDSGSSNAAPDDGTGEVPPDDGMNELPPDDGPDMLDFDDPLLDPPSQGGTLTFESIGSPGWYPSRRDPASGQCDARQTDTCCMTRHEVSGDNLAPWDEEPNCSTRDRTSRGDPGGGPTIAAGIAYGTGARVDRRNHQPAFASLRERP